MIDGAIDGAYVRDIFWAAQTRTQALDQITEWVWTIAYEEFSKGEQSMEDNEDENALVSPILDELRRRNEKRSR